MSAPVSRMGMSLQSLHAVLRGEAAVTADLVATVRALPFRSDRPSGVPRARGEKIAAALFRRDLTFTCHETTEQPVPQHCARALILHETLGRRYAIDPQAITAGRLPQRAPVVTSAANPHYQKHFDRLFELPKTGDCEG